MLQRKICYRSSLFVNSRTGLGLGLGLGLQVMLSRNLYRQWFFFGKKPQRQLKRFQHASTLQAEAILSKENRARCLSYLQGMKPIGTQITSSSKKAAVLVPLCMADKELSLLYTLRSADLKSYRGQVSFPGGMNDKSDKSLEETALRETYEELGISKDQVDVWGRGSYVSTVRKDMAVMPFIGYIGNINVKKLNINPTEVESTFTIPLRHLCNPINCRYTQFRNSYILPVFIGGEHRIWGMTAVITHILLTALIPGQYKHKIQYVRPVNGNALGKQDLV